MDKDAAVGFLESNLAIPNVQEMLQHQRLSLLNAIAERWSKMLPFQTISQVARPLTDRSIPSPEQSIQDITSGIGGMCWSHNITLYYILKALGFKMQMCISAVMNIDILNHIVPVVKDVEKQGDKYIVDVGNGYPRFQAVSLDFEQESPIFRLSFNTFKFTREEDCIICYHLTSKGKDKTGRSYASHNEKGWAEHSRFWLKECDLDYLKEQLDRNVYSKLDFRFNKAILICKFPNGKLVALKEDIFLMENDQGFIQDRKVSSVAEMKAIIREFFPEIPMPLMDKALANWQKK